MTVKEMVQALVDKGHSNDYALREAVKDHDDLKAEEENPGLGTQECSVCRRWFSYMQMKYHYHPCE